MADSCPHVQMYCTWSPISSWNAMQSTFIVELSWSHLMMRFLSWIDKEMFSGGRRTPEVQHTHTISATAIMIIICTKDNFSWTLNLKTIDCSSLIYYKMKIKFNIQKPQQYENNPKQKESSWWQISIVIIKPCLLIKSSLFSPDGRTSKCDT